MKLKYLFITRNYPPKTGGLEVYSFNLIKEFETHEVTFKIVLTKSLRHLFWFLPYCLLKALRITSSHSIQSIHLCDSLLAPIGILLKMLTTAKISVTAVGLDITYRNRLYQIIIPWCVARLDSVICISRSTRDECVSRHIPYHKCTVIPIGTRPEDTDIARRAGDMRVRAEELTGVPLDGKTILLTVGRLVKRKGVAWFVQNVIPHLHTSYHYIIAGDGPEYGHIQKAVKGNRLQGQISILGKVSNDVRNILYNWADIFIMPNITVPGDVEGFGIVAIEAGTCGLPVVGTNIQGIRDAVIDGETGYLVDEGDVEGFLERIKEMDLDKDNIRSIVNNTFDWAHVYEQYRTVLTSSCIKKIV